MNPFIDSFRYRAPPGLLSYNTLIQYQSLKVTILRSTEGIGGDILDASWIITPTDYAPQNRIIRRVRGKPEYYG